MIEKIIEYCARNRFLVFLAVLLTVWGVWAMRFPLDAVPDISDVQVIVSTEWAGRSPDLIEDQVTYPIVTALISTPHVKAVRGFTDFGISYVYVIFEDGTDIYWARSRVVEYLQGIRGQLPEGVNPIDRARRDRRRLGVRVRARRRDRAHTLSPSCAASRTGTCATGSRACPAWRRSPASAGSSSSTRSPSTPMRLAAVRPLDPGRRDGHPRSATTTSRDACSSSAGREYMVRGRGYLKSVADIEQVSLGADERGTPIRVGDVARRRPRAGHPPRRRRARRPGRSRRRHRRHAVRRERAARHRPREGEAARRCRARPAGRRARSCRPTTAPG